MLSFHPGCYWAALEGLEEVNTVTTFPGSEDGLA